MSETATPAESGPLSIDQAVAALNPPPPEDNPAPEGEAVEETQSEAEPTADESDDPETVIEADEDKEPESDPEAPAIAAPKSWDAKERAVFATLSSEAQEIILGRETERDKATSKVMQEASEARQRAEQEAAGLGQFKDQLTQVLTSAQTTFADKWLIDGQPIDWVAWMSQDFEAASIAKFQHDEEKGQLAQLAQAQTQAENVAFQSFLKAEAAKLPTVCPDLVDPMEGPARHEALSKFLRDLDYTPEQIRQSAANDLSIAYDAMRWRQAQAGLAAPKPKPVAAQPARTVRPSAPPAQQSSQARTAQTAKNRFAQTHSVDDAVALLLAKGT